MMMKFGLTKDIYSIEDIEGFLLEGIDKNNIIEAECPVKHTFSDGVYCREVFMPKGSIVIGHEHLTEHLNIISKGSCILLDIDTGEKKTIKAPYTFKSKANIRKIVYIISDCVWINIHKTDLTDVDEIENTLIKKNKLKLTTVGE